MNHISLENWLQQQPYDCAPSSPCLFILMGLSGSGKSTVSRFLAKHYNAVWISSDIERQHRYFGREDMYSSEVTQELFEYMTTQATRLLQANYPVIIDSCALRKNEREAFQQAADNNHCPVVLIFCRAPEDILKGRIRLRLQTGNDPSQARPELIDAQKQWLEPPSINESLSLISLNINQPDWETSLTKELNLRL